MKKARIKEENFSYITLASQVHGYHHCFCDYHFVDNNPIQRSEFLHVLHFHNDVNGDFNFSENKKIKYSPLITKRGFL